MHHRFQAEQWLPYPVGTAFAFFALPLNLPRLMPAAMQAKIEEARLQRPPLPPPGAATNIAAAGVGSTLVVSFRPFASISLRQNWHVKITEFAWNDHFTDIQTRGPFALWNHTHSVEAQERNGIAGTIVRDDLHYAFRGGPFGLLANALGGGKRIEATFAYRRQQLEKLMPLFAPQIKFDRPE